MEKSLYGLGSTTVLSVRAVGMAYAKIAVDDVCPGQVLLLVMPDTVQQLDVIIGREWPDMPSVEYRKVDGQLHLYRAEPCSGQIEPTVTTVGCDADYIHTVEVREIPVRLPLVESDFGYVKSDVTAVEREGLLELVNEYRDCFAKDLDTTVRRSVREDRFHHPRYDWRIYSYAFGLSGAVAEFTQLMQ
ncbi:hypothetical protein QTP88_001583 [Uroleucon formosanum]